MRILLLSSDTPLPITNGIRLRTYHLFSRLSRKHEITLLTFYRSPEDLEGLRQLAGQVVRTRIVRGVNRSTFLDHLKGCLSPTPFFVERVRSRDMQEALARELEECDYDLLFVNDLRMAHYAASYRSIPRVIDACDALSLLFRRAFHTSTHLRQRINFLQLWLKTRRYEVEMYSKFDLCTVVSPVDGASLQKSRPDLKIAVVGNGVDTTHFHPADIEADGSCALVFVGVMDYPPNVDAVRHFANDVFPEVRQRVPSARFLIVGRSGSQETLGLRGAANVEIIGTVPDVRPFVWQSAIFICPMRFGSGVKNKVLEAMAMAKPVVGTPLAYEGLEVVSGEHVVAASEACGLAESIIDLLSNEEKRRELGRKARKLVETKYSWQSAADRLDSLLENVVADWKERHSLWPSAAQSPRVGDARRSQRA